MEKIRYADRHFFCHGNALREEYILGKDIRIICSLSIQKTEAVWYFQLQGVEFKTEGNSTGLKEGSSPPEPVLAKKELLGTGCTSRFELTKKFIGRHMRFNR